jgi:hypothetical protein
MSPRAFIPKASVTPEVPGTSMVVKRCSPERPLLSRVSWSNRAKLKEISLPSIAASFFYGIATTPKLDQVREGAQVISRLIGVVDVTSCQECA